MIRPRKPSWSLALSSQPWVTSCKELSVLSSILPPDCLVYSVLACVRPCCCGLKEWTALPDKTAKEDVQLEVLPEAGHCPGLTCSCEAHLLPLSGMMCKP